MSCKYSNPDVSNEYPELAKDYFVYRDENTREIILEKRTTNTMGNYYSLVTPPEEDYSGIRRIYGGLGSLPPWVWNNSKQLSEDDEEDKDEGENEETSKPGPTPDCSFTDEEKQEMTDRPITRHFTEFTPEQFQVRLSIAKKLCAYFLDDNTISSEFREIYEAYPMWGFYLSGTCAQRSFGVAVNEHGESVLHTQTAHLGFDNITVGGTPTKDLVRVDQWSDDTISFIKATANPGLYLDPLGFYLILHAQAR